MATLASKAIGDEDSLRERKNFPNILNLPKCGCNFGSLCSKFGKIQSFFGLKERVSKKKEKRA